MTIGWLDGHPLPGPRTKSKVGYNTGLSHPLSVRETFGGLPLFLQLIDPFEPCTE